MLWSGLQRTTQEKGKEKCVVLTTNTNKRKKRRNIWHGIIYTPPKIETYSKHLPRRNCCSLRLYCVFVHSLPPLTIVVVTHHTLPCAPWLLSKEKDMCISRRFNRNSNKEKHDINDERPNTHCEKAVQNVRGDKTK